MDVNMIFELIGTFGFPVVCCIYMMTTMNKTLQSHTDKTQEMMNAMSTSLALNTEAINHLTMFINSFVAPVGSESKDE